MKTKIQNLFIALAWLALPALVQAQFTFTTNNGAITITGYNTAAGLNAVIPATTNGYPVTSIGNSAFDNSSITSVTIPTSITSIGDYAFKFCSGLTSVTIPNSVTNIGVGVFEHCTSLTSVTIPNSVTSIGTVAFYFCFSLTSVTIPNSVTSLGGGVFEFCSSLTSVTIPGSVTSIGDYAFDYCTSLTNITVDASNPAYSSMNGVLFDKAQATLLEFPGGLGGSYTIPASVTSIGDNAFSYCTSLTAITVDTDNPAYRSVAGVLFDIGEDALIQYPSGDTNRSYTIPGSVTSIGDSAFANCQSLTSVTIPNSVTNIGDFAFHQCRSLTNATIGSGVTSIGNYAFEFCHRLTSVTIPNSVTSIGEYAFYGTSLTSAYFLGNAPPDNGNAFYLVANATVYYLVGTTGWGSTFGSVPAVLWNSQANTFGFNTFGFTGGQFGFNLTGPAYAVIVVEASTNLSNPVWLPISTNTLSGFGTSAFSDPQWTNYPGRFYRLRSP